LLPLQLLLAFCRLINFGASSAADVDVFAIILGLGSGFILIYLF
jgi:hypothetical protein